MTAPARRPDTVPCVLCGRTVPVGPRGPRPRHCETCKHNRDAGRQQAKRRSIANDVRRSRNAADALRPHLTPAQWQRAKDYLADLGVGPSDPAPIVADRMPAGSFTPEGSNDGVSTGRVDLRDDLEYRRVAAITHDWFAENPRWADPLVHPEDYREGGRKTLGHLTLL